MYNAIRKSPRWEESLLIITYDEHGRFYDHIAPPIVRPEKFQTRLSICKTCPAYHPSAKKVLQKFANLMQKYSPFCMECGCSLNKKAKIATVSCPKENPLQLGFTLWRDPIK